MKRFFSKYGIWLLAGVAIIVVVLCIISAVSSGTPFLRNAAGVIASPFRAAGSAVADWVSGITDRFDSVEDLQQENEALRKQVADLERQLRGAQKDIEENQRLRNLLDIHDVTFHWVKGHAQNENNNRCDQLAVEAWKKIKNN